MKDITLGRLLFLVSILAMIGYFVWLFVLPEDLEILGRSLREWALIVPVLIVVYAFLVIVAWMGWALASTPPPLPLASEEDDVGNETTSLDE